MAFTYDLSDGFSDLERVRFYINDTDSSTPIFQDEEITALITETGSWQAATLACVGFILRKLAQPGFTADWLQVDNESAFRAWKSLEADLQNELSVGGVVSGSRHVYRKDSRQQSEPDYDYLNDYDPVCYPAWWW